MTPDALLIIGAIRAGFEFGTQLIKYLMTEEGKKLVIKSLEDRAAWDKFWGDVAGWLEKFISGELFRAQPESP